ncbi:glutamate carboxypeptidase II [Methylocaldum marinum]|uniref:Glutamate carboxypeptidase II n=1 Tax=Methylocaldum marinum TaxID=1432792 RepID=A0A250KXD2_9GAMM|nr:glutamate carboxypeptidase II [Methylocaldum marinum]
MRRNPPGDLESAAYAGPVLSSVEGPVPSRGANRSPMGFASLSTHPIKEALIKSPIRRSNRCNGLIQQALTQPSGRGLIQSFFKGIARTGGKGPLRAE